MKLFSIFYRVLLGFTEFFLIAFMSLSDFKASRQNSRDSRPFFSPSNFPSEFHSQFDSILGHPTVILTEFYLLFVLVTSVFLFWHAESHLLGFTGFSFRASGLLTISKLTLLGFTQFFFKFFSAFTGFYLVLRGFTSFYLVLLGFTGFYLVLRGFTGFY